MPPTYRDIKNNIRAARLENNSVLRDDIIFHLFLEMDGYLC